MNNVTVVVTSPWYSWPTTAAMIAAIFLFFFTYWSYRLNRQLKWLEAKAHVRLHLSELMDAISLATMPSPDFGGERFDAIGGWDELINRANRLEAHTQISY